MAKNKKPLLNEGTIRRMMKLAEIPSLSVVTNPKKNTLMADV